VSVSVAAAAQSIPFDLLADMPDVDVKTVTRIIIDLTLLPNDPDAAVTGGARMDLAIGVAAQEAFTAGVVPDPNLSSDYPTQGWLWIASPVVIHVNASGTTEAFVYPRVQADLGAQRKVDKGVLYFVANNTTIVGSGESIQIAGRLRSLVLL